MQYEMAGKGKLQVAADGHQNRRGATLRVFALTAIAANEHYPFRSHDWPCECRTLAVNGQPVSSIDRPSMPQGGL